ncbi:unnamed protein product [Anisakis simplex]|uniref:DUF4005 domain-containing protein n=1 Tax=Anisakis simplex TaxID=6269 RepID=A0A0M3KJN7_ANISI|nr:unnamed protein product [Anisakis simplex]VDK78146.1 unnamed protein product [Anisakis simplex]
MTAPSGNICEREGRPSALGHFLSKFGARKSRSKSPTMTLSLKCKASTLPTNGTPSNGTTQFRMSNNDVSICH